MTPLPRPRLHPRLSSRRRCGGAAVTVLLVLGALLLLGVLLAGPVATRVANRKLDQLEGVRGHLDGITVALWRGGLSARGLTLVDRERPEDVPLLKLNRADMRISWGALFRGRLGGALTIDGAELNLVQTELPTPEEAAEAKEKMKELQAKLEPWRRALQEAFPMELSRLEVKNAAVHFIDRARQPHSRIGIDQLHLVGTGLSNRADGEAYPAKLDMTGVLTGNGDLRVQVEANPLEKQPTFRTVLELKPMDLRAWNDFLRALAKVDVGSGFFEFYVEAEAKAGTYQGYVKPFFKELNFHSASDQGESLGTRIKEAAADVVTAVLDNNEEGDKQVATKAPFSGSFAGTDVDVWTAVETLLRNAFVEGLREGFDRGLLGRRGGGGEKETARDGEAG